MARKDSKNKYKSPEARARQLAALSGVRVSDHVHGVDIEKTNGKGALASVSLEMKKHILDLFCKGTADKVIAETVGLNIITVNAVKQDALDHDSQFRSNLYKVSLKAKIQAVVEGATDRVNELMPEMSAKDAVLALGITLDKLLALEKTNGPETLHQHVHLHAPAELNSAFMAAMQPKNTTIEHES
jgi:hypothetical protein